jgi:hypothetical protein
VANISITIPDAQLTRVIDGIAGQHNYQITVPAPNPLDPPVPNPETKSQFAKRMMIKWAKENVKAWEATLAANAARDTAVSSAESTITIT